MTTLNLKTLESALEARARELARSVTERNRITIEKSADAFDATLLAAEREASAQSLTQDFRLLREVEAARDRMRRGAYGICLRGEEEIPPKRLQAVPWAAYCLLCQAAAEKASPPQLARAA